VAQAARRLNPLVARAAAVSDLGEVLRRDRTPTVIADPKARGDGITALGMAYIAPSALAAAAPMTVSQIGC
jgi:hypothetical protein